MAGICTDMRKQTIAITGAAGLVGQNLVMLLAKQSNLRIIAIDKHSSNLEKLRRLQPQIHAVNGDLSEKGEWQCELATADIVIVLHAQISGLSYDCFEKNNITATQNVIDVVQSSEIEYLVHVSSSVLESRAVDFYTESKKLQERIVLGASVPRVVLRPTLMFGLFDRKHLGWLRRFLQKTPVFPIPGNGKFRRQPLYVGDFCAIIESCLEHRTEGTHNISGLEHIDYIDMIKAIRKTVNCKTPLLNIPVRLFKTLLSLYAVFDRNPPFTASQLDALVIPEVFETFDWPCQFRIEHTPLNEALQLTFCDKQYSNIVLDF